MQATTPFRPRAHRPRHPLHAAVASPAASLLHRLAMLGGLLMLLAAGATMLATGAARAADPGLGFTSTGAPIAPAVPVVSTHRSVKVGLNKSLVIDLPRDARDILVSNPVIADAVIRTPRRIYVTGVAVGQSNVLIFDRAGQTIISLDLQVERDTAGLAEMLHRLIPDSDIHVEIVSDNIVLSGSVRNAADSRRAQDIANIFANGGAEAQAGGGSSSSAASNGTASITISTSSQTPTSTVINMLTIEGEDQVHLKVTVAEVQRSVAKQLGVELSGEFNIANVVGSLTTGNPWGVNSTSLSDNAVTAGYDDGTNSLTATLRALEQTGMVKTLAEPTLTAISGESASFLAGGEFPFPTGADSSGNVSVSFKPFGVALSFTPVVLSEGRISLRVKTEVSDISNQVNVSLGSDISIPGLDVRRAETTMELPSGGSLVLGGLIQDSLRQSIGAVPGLGKLPILGQLFRSRDFQRHESELVIIVTPYLVKPVPRSALATPDQGMSPASDARATLLGNINRVYGGPGVGKGSPSYADQKYKGFFGFIFE